MAEKLPNMQVSVDKVEEMWNSLHALARSEVLVGFPEDTTGRDNSESANKDITNAALGYIHDNGMPEQNIPARPFMVPGIMSVKDQVTGRLLLVAKRVLRFQSAVVIEQGWHSVGLTVATALKKYINQGIAPALAESTLRERAARGRKGAKQELANRAAGLPASTQLAKPLIDTGQLRNAINYVIRPRRK